MQTSLLFAAKKYNKLSVDYRRKGYEAQQKGNLDMALGYYQRAIHEDSSYALAYNDMGVILEAKGMVDKAKESYLKAISLDPTLLSPYYNVAALYESEGDVENAAYYWEMRIHLGDWDDEWTWKAKERLEKIDKSLAEGDGPPRAARVDLKLKPDPKRDATYHMYKGKKLVIEGKYFKAVREFNAALLYDPNNVEIERSLDDATRKANLYQ